MKRMKLSIKIIAMIMLILPLAFMLSACGDNESNLNTFTNVVFANQTVDYDGEEHQIVVSGELPDGVSIVYELSLIHI